MPLDLYGKAHRAESCEEIRWPASFGVGNLAGAEVASPLVHRQGVALILVSAVAFGTMAVIARKGHEAGLDVPTFMLLRFALAAAVMGGVGLLRREAFPRGKNLLWLVGMGAGLYVGQSLAYFNAMQSIPAAMASLLLYLYPVFVTVLAVLFFGERLTWMKGFALTLALAGSALIIGPVSGGSILGVGLAVAAAAFYSLYILAGAQYRGPSSPSATTFTIMGSAAVVYAGIVGIQGPSPITPAGFGWGALLALVSVIAVGGFLIGLANVSPVDASVLSALEPIVTALMAMVFLHEMLSPLQSAGGVVILVAVIVLVRQMQEKPAEPQNAMPS